MEINPPPSIPPVQNQPSVPPVQNPGCPRCGDPNISKVTYTWWGGLLGPSMLNLMRCRACKYEFNGKTGQSTKNAVIAYNLVAFGLVLLIVGIGIVIAMQR